MAYFRTKNGFIFEGEAEIGQTFIYDTTQKSDVKDEVVCVGERLKDLLQKGDLIEYDFNNQEDHCSWILKLNSERTVDAFKNHPMSIVRKIFIKCGQTYIESPVLSMKETQRNLWVLGKRYVY